MQTHDPSPDSTESVPANTAGKRSFAARAVRQITEPWLHTWLIFSGLVVISTIDLGWWVGIPLFMMGLSVFYYLFRQAMGFKNIFFYANVRDDSSWQRFRIGVIIPAFFALLGALVLPFSLVVFLLTVHPVTLTLVLLLQLIFFPIRFFYRRLFVAHLKPHSRRVLVNFATVFSLGVVTTVALILAKWVEFRYLLGSDILNTADHMADYVEARVNHGVIYLQHLARTMQMFDLQLARAYWFAQGWVAHLILIYFLIPSTLAAFALPLIQGGGILMMESKDGEIGSAEELSSHTAKDSGNDE